MTTRIFIGGLIFLFVAVLIIVIGSGESERMDCGFLLEQHQSNTYKTLCVNCMKL